jgi:Family of unknown function (DUF5918)/U-box domain
MINFLDHKFRPKLQYDCVCDLKAENLISENAAERNEGFMAYAVTKPPVELNFEVVSLIRVHSISISAQIGGLKSTGFEVWAKRSSSSEYQRVGQAYLEPLHTGVLFHQRPRAGRIEAPSGFLATEFWTNATRTLNACQFVKVVIKRTNSCAPVIKAIKIWGQPAIGCPVETKNWIAAAAKTGPPEIIQIPPAEPDNPPSNTQNEINISGLEIPEDFLDALTCDIMSLPMTLPSGKVIDQTALEKHNKHEENWGRPPCDPFTGRLYTNTHRPLLDVALKARIDLFLLQNSHHTVVKAAPRTTGRLKALEATGYTSTSDRQVAKRIRMDTGTDLNAAVQSALSQITRFSKPAATVKRSHCGNCQREPYYQILTCKHFSCRECLVRLSENSQCFVCKIKFRKEDIERFHS